MLELVASKYAKDSGGYYKAFRVDEDTVFVSKDGQEELLEPGEDNFYVQWGCSADSEENKIFSSGYSIRMFETIEEVEDFFEEID